MGEARLIGLRHLAMQGRRVPVVLMRNANGTVAGQCLLENSERPILDASGVQEVLTLISDTLEALILSRAVSR